MASGTLLNSKDTAGPDLVNNICIKKLDIPYEAVIEPVREALKKEGFRVLAETDVEEKIKEKLGLGMRRS
jgi:hypothetical protein